MPFFGCCQLKASLKQSGDFLSVPILLTTLSDSSLSSFSRTGSGTLRAGCTREEHCKKIGTNLINSQPVELDRGSGKWHLCHSCLPLQDSGKGNFSSTPTFGPIQPEVANFVQHSDPAAHSRAIQGENGGGRCPQLECFGRGRRRV